MLKAVIAKNGWRLVDQAVGCKLAANGVRSERAPGLRAMGMAVSSYRYQTTRCDEELRTRLGGIGAGKSRASAIGGCMCCCSGRERQRVAVIPQDVVPITTWQF
jgi:hypothetical protein